MLAYGLKDPYMRFITPAEFEAMRKYDVTGVGLNLATAEEFTRKSGMQLPEDRKDAEVRATGALHDMQCSAQERPAARSARSLCFYSLTARDCYTLCRHSDLSLTCLYKDPDLSECQHGRIVVTSQTVHAQASR